MAMQRFILSRPLAAVALVAVCLVAGPAVAQQAAAKEKEKQPAAKEPAVDNVSKQASQLEAELGRYKDASPEAAEAMLKLIDLYYEDARLFGVVRIGRKFIVAQSNHERHKEVMLKLMDALEATARYTDLAAVCRQFIGHYPDAPECYDVDLRLCTVLDQLGKTAEAAEAYAAGWRHNPNAKGRRFGASAVQRYNSINTPQSRTEAAKLAEEMLDKSDGAFAEYIGWQAFYTWRGLNDWAKANQVGSKLLKRNMPSDKMQLRSLHEMMGQHDTNLGQHGNAVRSVQQARALGDTQQLHAQLINAMYSNVETKPAELQAIVNEYAQKYPDATDRYYFQSYIPQIYFRNNEKDKAMQAIAQLLPNDAASQNHGAVYIQQNGNEPAQLAQSEQVLLGALKQNKKDAAYLRYVLAFELYRDRMKDTAKMRQMLRDLAVQSPENSNMSQQAIIWLLNTAPNDGEFNADVAALIKTRQENLHLSNYVSRLGEWAAQAADAAKANKDAVLAQRVARVTAELNRVNNDPVVQGWFKSNYGGAMDANASAYRYGLIASGQVDKLPEQMAWSILYNEGYWARYQSPANLRSRSVEVFDLLCKRFPDNVTAAYAFMEACYQYGTPAQGHEALQHFLKVVPVTGDAQHWYYAMLLADRSETKQDDPEDVKAANLAKNKEMVGQVLAYVVKSQQQLGVNPTYSTMMGDTAVKYELNDQALAFWKLVVGYQQQDHPEVIACHLRIAGRMEGAARINYLQQQLKAAGSFPGQYAQAIANYYLLAADFDNFEKTLRQAIAYQSERAISGSGFDEGTLNAWSSSFGVVTKEGEEPRVVTDEQKQRVWTVVRDIRLRQASALAELNLLAATDPASLPAMQRVLRYQRAAQLAGNAAHYWDQFMPHAQAALTRKDYLATATLVTGMLANITAIDETRRKTGRDMVAQSYSRIGTVGLTIDEDSPIAPLLQAALLLRLGDDRLAFDAYSANQKLFDEHRSEMPVDFLLFVCEKHSAAGGEENFNRVEDILRGWIVQYSESPQFDDETKARVQLQLARNFFQARRFDIARSEFTTVKNRYAETPEALEAEFGIGETFMAQKVYDQAEAVFDKLANSDKRDVVIRAEFMRGVLAYRRGDRDEARQIFQGVLDRVPDVELANQSLFNLAEVYGAEERFAEQLNLLRTVGRFGRNSKRRHKPGMDLSIVVQDSDLGISRGGNRVPVIVTTEPGGDEELVYITSGAGGKGLFRADLRTELGKVQKHDRILQLTGNDRIKCDYPPEFKAQFRQVPLSDVDIHVAADAEFEVASSLIVDKEEESFSQRLERETSEAEQDKRVSQDRPANQVKPGNQVYLRVKDADRDLSDNADKVVVKLSAQSGDEVQVTLTESGPHTGVFAGTAPTGELPAGALATDSAIQHSPLMAIDRDRETYWLSEPNGAVPKALTIDMKDLRLVSRVRLSTPDPDNQAPVRGDLYGSNDGEFWFLLASNPPRSPVQPVAGEFAAMTRRVYAGNYTNYSDWNQVVNLSKNGKPIEEEVATDLSWSLPETDEQAKNPHGVIWHGKFIQPRDGAVRFAVVGTRTALVLNGYLELPVAPGGHSVDVYLPAGAHDLTIFAATGAASQPVAATRARATLSASSTQLQPFKADDFDLAQPVAKVNALATGEAEGPAVLTADGDWGFRFEPIDLRYVRFVVHEYLGEAVAINHVEVRGDEDDQLYIPTEADVLALASNDVLEIAGGDVITATYTDEETQSELERSRLLSQTLTATFFNGNIATIDYDLLRNNNGTVGTIRKDLMRIDPGDRFIVEIVDYDRDETDQPDTVKFQVMVNDGEPVDFVATETEPYTGIFTKEVDTSPNKETGKLQVKQGDRVYCRYIDSQNTFPGHSVPREATLYVREPTEGIVRIIETRFTPGDKETKTPPRVSYLPPDGEQEVSSVALEVPLTVEVIDRDAAKDSRSSVDVTLITSEGVKLDVTCMVSGAFANSSYANYAAFGRGTEASTIRAALEEGRFVGQVILQLGGKNSPDVVPLSADMPRSLVGGARLDDEQQRTSPDQTLVTRVLNVTGKDVVTSTYSDKLRPAGAAASVDARARLVTNGQLACTDREYEKSVTQLHVGEKMFLAVIDPDQDTTDERDTVEVEITSENGEKETVKLEETLAHSGTFNGSLTLKPSDAPTPGNLNPEDPILETFFGDIIRATYLDKAASDESGQLELELEVPVVIGTDGLVSAFSKTFNNEKLAVETKFHIAESYFELFKSHKQLGREGEEKTDLEAGRRVLREVMEDYPDPKYVPRIAYLLGQFSQELEQWNEAIDAYDMIVRQFPDHSLAADAQYKLAQCYEEAGDFDLALEAYVTLAATYPKSPLIANVMIRISDYFYKQENYEVAAQVGEKFLDRFEGHQHASRIAFRVGQAYYKAKLYGKASTAFDKFVKDFPDDQLCSDALFWSGESFRMANNNSNAFRRYNRCRWDFPASEAAKYARGRLTLPEMLQQFEQEALSLEKE